MGVTIAAMGTVVLQGGTADGGPIGVVDHPQSKRRNQFRRSVGNLLHQYHELDAVGSQRSPTSGGTLVESWNGSS